MLFTSACSLLDLVAPPPLETAFHPLPPPPAPPVPPQSPTPPTPEEARAEIYRWFMKAGYKPFQAEALMEHAQTESGFRVCARGVGDLSYTYQWAGTRLRKLHEFAHTDGCPQLDTQLAFADKELRNDPKFSCFWGATTEPGAYAALRRGFGRGSC
jgi:hypothetical protein